MKKFILGIFLIILQSSLNAQSITIDTVGSGVNITQGFGRGYVYRLYNDTIDNLLYAVGKFVHIGGKKVYGIAKWDGQQWDSLGSGLKQFDWFDGIQNVHDIIRYKNEIYVTGAFTKCGGKNLGGIARWNGVEWNDVGGATANSTLGDLPSVFRMEIYQNELYIIGSFTSIGNVQTNGIAKWDGQTWTDLSQNFPADCYLLNTFDLIHYKNELYIGGNFNCNSGAEEPLLKRVGNQWIPVGSGFNGDASINKFTIYQNNLYVGGYFFTQNGNTDNSMIYTDGVTYTGTAGGVLPSNLTNMFEYQNELYICGQIDIAGGQPINRIAKWDGNQWRQSGLSIGPNSRGTLLAFAEYNGKLILGGSFEMINSTTAFNIASVDFGTSSINTLSSNSVFTLYPNPTSNSFSVKANDQVQLKKLEMYNAIGQKVFSQEGNLQQAIDVSFLSKGMYFITIATDKGIAREKLIVE